MAASDHGLVPPAAGPPPLIITGNPATRGIQVSGPIDDPLICDWLLAAAKRLLDKRHNDREDAAQGNGKRIVPVVGAIPRFQP